MPCSSAGSWWRGRLAACVNVLGSIASIYRWEGEVCEEEEVAFIAKTRAELVPGAERTDP